MVTKLIVNGPYGPMPVPWVSAPGVPAEVRVQQNERCGLRRKISAISCACMQNKDPFDGYGRGDKIMSFRGHATGTGICHDYVVIEHVCTGDQEWVWVACMEHEVALLLATGDVWMRPQGT